MLQPARESAARPQTKRLPGFMEWQELSSLVGTMHTRSLVAKPTTVAQCREALAYCRQQGLSVCSRGAGRTYGDDHALANTSTPVAPVHR